MSVQDSDATMAVFLDLENIALGAHDADFPAFDIRKVLERLLLKGQIVVKKAYCDFERYKTFKRGLHEAAFELIEIPHVRQSGKNSADIRMVVDALDLCYTKAHVQTFVIISGDSDFSPLVSKLRENDEFIFYDDLVRAKKKSSARKSAPKPDVDAAKGGKAAKTTRGGRATKTAPKEIVAELPAETSIPPEAAAPRSAKSDEQRAQEALDMIVETVEALITERGDEEKVWGSMVKQALKRRNPGFNESFYGFRSFNGMLEGAQRRGLLALDRDEKSGGYVVRLTATD